MLYLIRHAECKANVDEIAASYTDSPLTEDGILQIEHLQQHFKGKKFKEVYSSPISRALLTSTALETSNHYVATVLTEINLSNEWENYNWHEIRAKYPLDYNKFLNLDSEFNSQYYENLISRINKLELFIERYKLLVKASYEDIAIVSHGATIKLLTSLILDKKPSDVTWLDNACFSIITLKECRPVDYVDIVNTHIPIELRGFTKSNWVELAE